MADQVDEIKQKTDIVSLIAGYVDLKKAGRNYKALCPFHSEKTPSFMVSPELQMYKCFGCSESGDAFTFLEKHEGMDFYEALKFLADKAGVKLKTVKPGQVGEKERIYQVNSLAGKFYQYVLLKHKTGRSALSYLTEKRGLKLDTIKKFQLGFSPDVPKVLENFLVNKKKFNQNILIRAGLVYSRGSNLYDRFFGRVIFPLFDHRGNIAGFAGRLLPDSKSDMAKYINSPETPTYLKSRLLYGLNFSRNVIKKEKSVIVVEGEIDMISSWQAGVTNVVAIKGSALTPDQVKLLRRFTDKITLAMDTDLAGDAAARRGIAIAQEEGFDITVADLKGYKDPDEMARKSPSAYEDAIEKAQGVWDYLIDSTFSKYKVQTGGGKAKISREIIPVLSAIPDKIVQAHYIEIVADKLNVPVEVVFQEVSDVKISKDYRKSVQGNTLLKVPAKSRRQLLEERLMTIAFQIDPKILLEKDVTKLISTKLCQRILTEFINYMKENDDFKPSDFSEVLPKELLKGFSEMILLDVGELSDDEDKLGREIDLIKKEIKILETKEKLNKLTLDIRKFEKAKDKKNLMNAEKSFGELSNKLTELEEKEDRGIIL